jgi:CHAD domain-containing protein
VQGVRADVDGGQSHLAVTTIIDVFADLYIMLESPRRYDLLRSRLRGFTRTLPRLKTANTRGIANAGLAVRRLREVLPILQFNGPTVEKITARLRRIGRRLEDVRQYSAMLELLDARAKTDRRGKQAVLRVRNDVQALADRASKDLFRKKTTNDMRRAAQKLTKLLEALHSEPDQRTQMRATQWAAKARVARRATEVTTAVDAAGSVYLASRLEEVRTAVKKLRYGAELVSVAAADGVAAADARALARVQELLGQLDDAQLLIDRVRHVQGSLATPDLKAWRDLDTLVVSLENRCRALHARYVRERPALLAFCERVVSRAPVDGSAKRKVG